MAFEVGPAKRVDFKFPIVALVGENGVGKSTILQAIAASYAAPEESKSRFASDYFPDTTWDRAGGATIRFSMRESGPSDIGSVRKPTDRWRGNPERKKRIVDFIDLRRVQPVAARVGYPRLAKPNVTEESAEDFDQKVVDRMSHIMGRKYDGVRLAVTNIDKKRKVPVITRSNASYSGFHSGAGEMVNAELLGVPLKRYSVFLIDEIETSLHPRTQRRLIRDLSDACREQECQIILTTHSPYILDELPPEGRLYIMDGIEGKSVIPGISAQFAMTRMDDEQHPECDIYVENDVSRIMLQEIIVFYSRDIIPRVKIVPFGAASVGRSLGIMAHQKSSRVHLWYFWTAINRNPMDVLSCPATMRQNR